jgi:hypothetical protein
LDSAAFSIRHDRERGLITAAEITNLAIAVLRYLDWQRRKFEFRHDQKFRRRRERAE